LVNRGLFIEGAPPARTTKIFEFSLAKLKGHDLRGSVPSFYSVTVSLLPLSVRYPTDAVTGSSTPASRKNRAASSGGVGLI
jgi:hypothetical protein